MIAKMRVCEWVRDNLTYITPSFRSLIVNAEIHLEQNDEE